MIVMRIIASLLFFVLMFSFSGCGKVKEASQLVKAVKDTAETVQKMSDGMDSEKIDLDNLNITDEEVRTFYSSVRTLHDRYPDIDFEVAMTATLEAAAQGKNLERIIEKETDMNFQEYSTLSMALIMIQTESMGVYLAEEMVAGMEEGLAQFNDMDTSGFTEEQLAEIENQRQALDEAKKELDTREFRNQKERADMVSHIREELMD